MITFALGLWWILVRGVLYPLRCVYALGVRAEMGLRITSDELHDLLICLILWVLFVLAPVVAWQLIGAL